MKTKTGQRIIDIIGSEDGLWIRSGRDCESITAYYEEGGQGPVLFAEVIYKDRKIERINLTKMERFTLHHEKPIKIPIIGEVGPGGKVTFYKSKQEQPDGDE